MLFDADSSSRFRTSRLALVTACAVLLGGAWVWVLADRAAHEIVEAGVWFEPVTFDESEAEADRLGGAITRAEMTIIESVASAEITHAFAGLRIRFSDRRDATYRVRVVQDLRNLRSRFAGPAGESRAIAGLGGQGAVSFRNIANNAIAHAPADAARATIVEAIGRGIGRTAVHEFAHQLLGIAPIHDTTDIRSYEYRSADRREQYYGEMHWDIAWPMLLERIGPGVSRQQAVGCQLPASSIRSAKASRYWLARLE